MSTTHSLYVLDMSKMEHLDGNNYKRWFEHMLFCFMQIELIYVLLMKPKFGKFAKFFEFESTDVAKDTARNDNEKDNFVQDPTRCYEKGNLTCNDMLLHHMLNVLFEIY